MFKRSKATSARITNLGEHATKKFKMLATHITSKKTRKPYPVNVPTPLILGPGYSISIDSDSAGNSSGDLIVAPHLQESVQNASTVFMIGPEVNQSSQGAVWSTVAVNGDVVAQQ